MTERLYHRDSSLLEFEGRIVEAGEADDKYYTILDRSAFYPTSGGQSHDIGTLGDCAIVDVAEDDKGSIRHLSDSPVGKIGDMVTGRIDESRRTRNRQMHTAQHLLSAAFFRVCQAATVSVHLGEQYGAVEFDVEQLTEEQLAQGERAANSYVESNVPVEVLFVPHEDLHKYNLRRPTSRQGVLRIIKVGDIDQSACGGTHCDRTGDVGFIKTIALEKMRKRSLVKFLTGRLLLDDYQARFDVTDRLTRQMTCAVEDLPLRIDRMVQSEKEKGLAITALQRELLPIRVAEAAREEQMIGTAHTVVKDMPELDPAIANSFVTELAGSIKGVAAVRLKGRLIVVSALSEIDASGIVRELAQRLGCRGGGSSQMAQLGGTDEIGWNECKDAIEQILS